MKFERISISADGIWFHDGVEITHEKTISLFKRSVHFENGKYFLSGEKVPVPIEVEDVAFFVTGVARRQNGYWISISDGSEEKLDCTTLDQNESNALYCLIRNRSVPARFERKAYHDLMKDLTMRDGYYGLMVDDLFYPIQVIEKPKPVEAKPVAARPVQAAKPGRKPTAPKKPAQKPNSKSSTKQKPKPPKAKPAPKKTTKTLTKKTTKKSSAKTPAARSKSKRK